jgi:hypothetical protein
MVIIEPEGQEQSNPEEAALSGRHKIINKIGKIITVAPGLDKQSWRFDPQTSAAGPWTSSDVQFSLEICIPHMGVSGWTNPNGGPNGGQTHS